MRKILLSLCLVSLLLILGCSKSDSPVIDLEGKSENWQVHYQVTKAGKDAKYMLQTIITPLGLTDVYEVEYLIDSPGAISEMSGTIKAEPGASIFPGAPKFPEDAIVRAAEILFLPPKGEQAVITIKWNESNSQVITLAIP